MVQVDYFTEKSIRFISKFKMTGHEKRFLAKFHSNTIHCTHTFLFRRIRCQHGVAYRHDESVVYENLTVTLRFYVLRLDIPESRI